MPISVKAARRLSIFTLPIVALISLQGCLSYHETAELFDDGSGEIRIVFGIANGTQETEKIREVRRSAKRLRGVHWIADVDSFSPGRHWHGSVFHFDSLAALRQFNGILPMEDLFGGLKLSATDSGSTLRRFVKLPAENAEDRVTMTIEWTFPGSVAWTDRRAKFDTGSSRAVWNFPTDGSAGESAKMEARWEPRGIPVSLWTRMPKGEVEWAAVGVALATFLLSIVAAFSARSRVRAMRRKLTQS
ncbi:MAG: hypothetical protein RL173_2414 [Fibrobacterota bacterium]|jgi:hypothetical protein